MRQNQDAPVREEPAPRRITATRQARKARRLARLRLISRHDWAFHTLRRRALTSSGRETAGEIGDAINYHLDRMEHHLDMLEAGR